MNRGTIQADIWHPYNSPRFLFSLPHLIADTLCVGKVLSYVFQVLFCNFLSEREPFYDSSKNMIGNKTLTWSALKLSPKTAFFLFLLSVGIILFFILDLVGIHLPLIARYAMGLIAIALYALLAAIKARMSRQDIKPKNN